jgi:hypothetical protein
LRTVEQEAVMSIRFLSASRVAISISLALSSACSPAADKVEGSASTFDSDDAGTGGTGGNAGSAAGGTGGSTISLDAGSGGYAGSDAASMEQVPVRSLPGLVSMTFYERTGGDTPTPYTFLVDGVELEARLDDPLDSSAFDIPGATSEYYDVYYSDELGEFDTNGSYLTISGVFELGAPWGGGLNLAEISLDFEGAPPEFGNYVASFQTLGDNKDDTSIEACIDGDLTTNTTMGNTIGSDQRLRLTLGFLSSSGPPPPIK